MEPISRREFLGQLARYGIIAAAAPAALEALGLLTQDAYAGLGTLKEVKHYVKLPNNKIQCFICPLNCILAPGETCFCRTRKNHDGILYNHAFNNPCILKLDPIEKLPLNHFHPGTRTLSIAIGGCNLRCLYCQNWEQSQSKPEDLRTFFFDHNKAAHVTLMKDIPTIAFTYTEPVVYSEYVIDIAQYTKNYGIRHVVASSLFMNPRAVKEFCQHLDALAIGLKGFTEQFYKNVCGQSLKPVLRAIETVRASGVWFELVNLVVPTYNDSSKDLKAMCRWIYRHLGANVPINFERFVPRNKLRNLPRTPVATLEKACDIARSAGIKYVYTSNIAPHKGNNTYCASCRRLLIERLGFNILNNRMKGERCPYCGTKIPGIWPKK